MLAGDTRLSGAAGRRRESVMELEGSFFVAAERGDVWDALANVRTLAGCIPGELEVEVEVTDERHARLGVRVRTGFFPVTLRGEIELVDLARPESLGMRASANALGTSATASCDLRLAAVEEGTTVTWNATVDISGPLAAAVSPLVERQAPTLAVRLAACLARHLGTGPGHAAARPRDPQTGEGT
jgi:uncharacterized protein